MSLYWFGENGFKSGHWFDGVPAYRGVLPVEDDLGDVVGWVQEVVVPPLVPVNGHCAVLSHATPENISFM